LRIKPKQLISAAGALAVTAALTAFAQSGAGQTALRRIGVVSSPVAYTELGFVTPLSLPRTLRRQPATTYLPFQVTNREHQARTYRWEIVVTDSSSRVARTGVVTLRQGAEAYLDPWIRLGCSRRTRITVALSSGESLNLWASCVGVSKAHPKSARERRPVGRTPAPGGGR
jgi:hypothetical protein